MKSKRKVNCEIIERAYGLTGTKNNAQLTKKIGISNDAFNNRKKRGTVHKLIFDWAMNNNYDLNYLFYGKGKKSDNIENAALLEIQACLEEEKKGRTADAR